MDSQKWFLIDNNLLRLLTGTGQETFLTGWRQWLIVNGVLQPREPAPIIVTPFSFLEALGIVLDDVPDFSLLTPGIAPSDAILFVHDVAHEYARRSEKLTRSHINFRFQECMKGCSLPGKLLFDSCFWDRVNSSAFVDQLESGIALDFTLGFQFAKDIFRPAHMVLWLMLKEQLEKGGDFPWYRLFKRMQDKIPGNVINKTLSKPTADTMRKTLALKSQQDRLDLEIVHFAMCGKLNGSKRLPVHVHTGDKPEVIRHRIALAKSAFQAIREKFEEENLDSAIFHTFVPGFVHCFDLSTRSPKETIEVSSVKSI